jgi:hypothetical protein
MSQMELPIGKTGAKQYAAFRKFHQENPDVFWLFQKFAEQALKAGCSEFGAKAIWERMRWHSLVETRGDNYKLNNSYTTYYARLLELTDERFLGFFEFRPAHWDVDDETLLAECSEFS